MPTASQCAGVRTGFARGRQVRGVIPAYQAPILAILVFCVRGVPIRPRGPAGTRFGETASYGEAAYIRRVATLIPRPAAGRTFPSTLPTRPARRPLTFLSSCIWPLGEVGVQGELTPDGPPVDGFHARAIVRLQCGTLRAVIVRLDDRITTQFRKYSRGWQSGCAAGHLG